jgi:hypothetical protein
VLLSSFSSYLAGYLLKLSVQLEANALDPFQVDLELQAFVVDQDDPVTHIEKFAHVAAHKYWHILSVLELLQDAYRLFSRAAKTVDNTARVFAQSGALDSHAISRGCRPVKARAVITPVREKSRVPA